MTRLDYLQLLIDASWGDTPQERIPPDVIAAAGHGREPRHRGNPPPCAPKPEPKRRIRSVIQRNMTAWRARFEECERRRRVDAPVLTEGEIN